MSLFNYKIAEIQAKLKDKEITVADLVNESINKIDQVEEAVQAFITVDKEAALAAAKQLDEKIDTEAAAGTLFGIPMAIKDNIVTLDLPTTAASKMLENFVSIYEATAMKKLHEAGAITVGKTNLDEFAMGSTTEKSYFKPTYNPWDKTRTPGGSSGGSAAAVASGEVMFALGSDTGGSIRQPAAFCNIVGMKPTYGRVSRYGLVALASSLDQIGPMTRTVEDNAYVLQAIAGLDPNDTTTADVEVPNFVEALTNDVKGLKIAVPKEYLSEDVSEEARQSVMDALKVFEQLGATWEEVSLPHTVYAPTVYSLISSGEASTSLARYDGISYGYRSPNAENLAELYTKTRAEGFGEEVKRRIILGTHTLSVENYERYFVKSQQIRTLIKDDFAKVFAEYDVIVGPTTAGPAYKLGEESADAQMNAMLTVPVNLASLPAISIPCGFTNALPLGLQIIGKHFDEATIYRAAHAFEQATDYHQQKPQM